VHFVYKFKILFDELNLFSLLYEFTVFFINTNSRLATIVLKLIKKNLMIHLFKSNNIQKINFYHYTPKIHSSLIHRYPNHVMETIGTTMMWMEVPHCEIMVVGLWSYPMRELGGSIMSFIISITFYLRMD
jgi:hypothetical protein